MGGYNTGHGSRSKQSSKNNQQAQELTVESIISRLLKNVDLYQITIAQAAAYMSKVKEQKNTGPKEILGSPERRLPEDTSPAQISSLALNAAESSAS